MSRLEELLANTRMSNGRQQDEVLLPNNLHIDVLVRISVKSCDAQRISDP